ncbi:uncharacterized protein PAC_00189 [Phialocephala subalpina]|uniref:MYND-type domain-containing protein n=1 Tax=Phialocephala subalpina TaxID=576137 RepID=A0A1L7WC07_9HELO|nr:uncharacterized protein PAC_00189 [Phialocephala subalpina]
MPEDSTPPEAPSATRGHYTDRIEYDIIDLALAFNKIPRSYRVSDGCHANHWHFTVRNILTADRDVLHIVNPDSRASHIEVLYHKDISLAPINVQVNLVISPLLKAFVKTICTTFTPLSAPWSWGTQDEDFAKEMASGMTELEIRKGLCRISFGDEQHVKIEQEIWSAEEERLKLVAKIGCKKCKQLPKSGQTFNRCSGCKEVQYCSKGCQRADWKEHKMFCQIVQITTSAARISTINAEAALDGHTYHVRNWASTPEVQTLAKKMGLKLPARCSHQIIRRLVITGNDTEDNFIKFFGLHAVDEEYLEDMRDEERLEALLKCKKGSFYYAMSTSHNYDLGCPKGALNPRKASGDEERHLDLIKSLQKIIREHMGARLHRITSNDMEDILRTTYGSDHWQCGMRFYIHALNSMDLGYPEGYNPCDYRKDDRTLRHWSGGGCDD